MFMGLPWLPVTMHLCFLCLLPFSNQTARGCNCAEKNTSVVQDLVRGGHETRRRCNDKSTWRNPFGEFVWGTVCTVVHRQNYNCKVFNFIFRSPDSGTFIIRGGPHLHRSCLRSSAKCSNERFHDTGDSSDPIKLSTEVGDRFGDLRLLAELAVWGLLGITIVCDCNRMYLFVATYLEGPSFNNTVHTHKVRPNCELSCWQTSHEQIHHNKTAPTKTYKTQETQNYKTDANMLCNHATSMLGPNRFTYGSHLLSFRVWSTLKGWVQPCTDRRSSFGGSALVKFGAWSGSPCYCNEYCLLLKDS